MAERLPGFDPAPIVDFFQSPPSGGTADLEWKTPDGDGLRAMLCDEYSFSGDRVNGALERLGMTAGQRTLDQWF